LIAGFFHAIHARIDMANPANAVIPIAWCHGLRANIAI
jgi:hypothetical protein